MVGHGGENEGNRHDQEMVPARQGETQRRGKGDAGQPFPERGRFQETGKSLPCRSDAGHDGERRKRQNPAGAGEIAAHDGVGDEAENAGGADAADQQNAGARGRRHQDQDDREGHERSLAGGAGHARARGRHDADRHRDRCVLRQRHDTPVAADQGDNQAKDESTRQHQPGAPGRQRRHRSGEDHRRDRNRADDQNDAHRHTDEQCRKQFRRCDVGAEFGEELHELPDRNGGQRAGPA